MNGTLNRLEQLEARFERALLDIQDLRRKLTQALQQIRETGARYTPTGGNTSNSLYWATNASSVGPATGTTLTGLTPAEFTSNICCDVGGVMTTQATSQTVRWWYLDTAAANSLIPVEPTADGTAWDAIGNGCTAL